jgi:hypothetical protein
MVLVKKERSLRFNLKYARNDKERRSQRNSNDRQRRLLTSSLLKILDELVPSQGNRKKSRAHLAVLTKGKCPSIDINPPIGKLTISFASSRRDQKKDQIRSPILITCHSWQPRTLVGDIHSSVFACCKDWKRDTLGSIWLRHRQGLDILEESCSCAYVNRSLRLVTRGNFGREGSVVKLQI